MDCRVSVSRLLAMTLKDDPTDMTSTIDTKLLHDVPRIRAGLDYLLVNDPVFSTLDIDWAYFDWAYMGTDFAAIVRIVAGQQVSTGAAKAIYGRLSEAINPMTPQNLLATDEDVLRACGFSRSKVAYVTGAANAMIDGTLDLDALAKKNADEVTADITALKGFGPWSAQCYLMFCLARPDIWVAGDLGIQEGLRRYLKQEKRPDAAQTLAAHEKFTPHGTAASLLLWYMKGL